MLRLGGRPTQRGYNALQVCRKLGLTANLKLCLDAGDGTSLPAASDKWNDLSGGGYDFYLGSGTGGDAADPTINGTAGRMSSDEYLSADGGDYLTYDAANETWMENIHKDNAVFSALLWAYPVTGADQAVAGTYGANSGANTGWEITISSGGRLIFRSRGASGFALNATITGTFAGSNWALYGVSLNEASASGVAMLNGTSGTFTSTYSSPSAGAATYTMQIGARGNNASPLSNGTRLGQVLMWEGRQLSAAEMRAFFTATRGRYNV